VAPRTTVRVFQTNTNKTVRITVPYDAEGIPVEGPMVVTGVPDPGAPIDIDFSQTMGASLGRGLLPTGQRIDRVDVEGVGEIECSIVDLANMCVFVRAADMGFSGLEMPEQGPSMAPKFFALKRAAQKLLGIGSERVVPWPMIVSEARTFTSFGGGQIEGSSYDFAMRVVGATSPIMHQAFMGTGASCTCTAAVTQGTIVNEFYAASNRPGKTDGRVVFSHPSGSMELIARVDDHGGADVRASEVVFQRTARLIMKGDLYWRPAKVEQIVRELGDDSLTRTGVPALDLVA
jgi:2-methylaconitate cis-trans-isomerase PrpF